MSTPTPQKPSQNDEDPITRPIHDEWGVYDPEQAGFEAILRKLSSKKKAPAVPDQARPAPRPTAQAPAVEDSVWMTPGSVPKPDAK
jgi:hypothetical protein